MAALATVPRVIGWCRRGVVRQDAARHASTTPLARSRYASAGCPSAAHGDKPTSVASPVRFDDLLIAASDAHADDIVDITRDIIDIVDIITEGG